MMIVVAMAVQVHKLLHASFVVVVVVVVVPVSAVVAVLLFENLKLLYDNQL